MDEIFRMLIDARTLTSDETIETEVCIVGAGPAGVTLAREFVGEHFRVCLLESGGVEYDESTQSLYQGTVVGDSMSTPYSTRRRQFGGTANNWNTEIGDDKNWVRYVPLDEIDFEKRDWVPHSGWPFDRAYLNPFYERAHAVCKSGPFVYDAEHWENANTPRLPLIGNRVDTAMFHFGPGNVFIHEYRDKISQSDNVTIYLKANVVDIETDETAGTVTHLRVACLEGNEFRVSAKLFILATGGIENARLLLLADQVQKAGLGNQNDLVGRFFMVHPRTTLDKLTPSSREIFNTTALYDLRQVNGVAVMGKLVLNQAELHREKLLNISAKLYPRDQGYWRDSASEAVNSFRVLYRSIRSARLPKHTTPAKHLSNVLKGIDDVAIFAFKRAFKFGPPVTDIKKGGWSALQKKERKFSSFELIFETEQAPDPDNRVVLGAERDRFGRRQVQLRWRWRDIDKRSIQRAKEIVGEEFAEAGLGQLQLRSGELLPVGDHHHIGTTRMHTDPKQGVVDQNCQVHGLSNLFIAGSSVFPTGGYANPTLTIVALATRLADHVKQIIAPTG